MHFTSSPRARAWLAALLVSGLLTAALAGPALAGKSGGSTGSKGGKTTTGSISLVMVADANGNGLPNRGDQVTYDVSKAGVVNPFITTTCVQNGVTVLTQYAGYYPTYLWPAAQTITLSNAGWTSGGATCTAVVQNTTIKLVYTVGA